ncbi:MAG: hypothetical protein DCC75_07565 [Proteobacteria bacterium]|nr:MAG: hypothetical protein DCC75_07565 [Pseudomonadota bacterium]
MDIGDRLFAGAGAGANLLDVFGLNQNAFKGMDVDTDSGLRRALELFARIYQAEAKAVHPDMEGGSHERMALLSSTYDALTGDPRIFKEMVRALQRVVPAQAALDQARKALEISQQRLEEFEKTNLRWFQAFAGFGDVPTVFNCTCKITLRDDWRLLCEGQLDADRDNTKLEQRRMALELSRDRTRDPVKIQKIDEDLAGLQTEEAGYFRTVLLENEPGRRVPNFSVVGPDGMNSPIPEKIVFGAIILSTDDWRRGWGLDRILRMAGILRVGQSQNLLGSSADTTLGDAVKAIEQEEFPASQPPENPSFIGESGMKKLLPLLDARVITPDDKESRIYLLSQTPSSDGESPPTYAIEGKIMSCEIIKGPEKAASSRKKGASKKK